MIYKCESCGKSVKVVRFDLDSKDKRQKCDKCYWNGINNIKRKADNLRKIA